MFTGLKHKDCHRPGAPKPLQPNSIAQKTSCPQDYGVGGFRFPTLFDQLHTDVANEATKETDAFHIGFL